MKKVLSILIIAVTLVSMIPMNLFTVGYDAFYGCSSLTSATIMSRFHEQYLKQ